MTYRLFQAGPFGLRAADLVGVDLFATGLLESVFLEVQVLLAGTHPGRRMLATGETVFREVLEDGDAARDGGDSAAET